MQHMLMMAAVALVVLFAVRQLTGSRSLAQMTAIQLITLVAIGVALSAVLLWEGIGLVEAVVGLAILLSLLFLSVTIGSRTKEPATPADASELILARNGQLLPDALERSGLSAEEVAAAVRDRGYGDISEVSMLLLEGDGRLTAFPASAAVEISASRRPGT